MRGMGRGDKGKVEIFCDFCIKCFMKKMETGLYIKSVQKPIILNNNILVFRSSTRRSQHQFNIWGSRFRHILTSLHLLLCQQWEGFLISGLPQKASFQSCHRESPHPWDTWVCLHKSNCWGTGSTRWFTPPVVYYGRWHGRSCWKKRSK